VVTALPSAQPEMAIFAPALDDKALTAKIDALRTEGHIVVQELASEKSDMAELNCNKKLEHYNSGWHVVDIVKS
ncbi:MAG: ATP phosphoribosyltransferase regulatory subunit, partial [Methylotenera sp.]